MKIKQKVISIIAILTLVVLVSGFQIDSQTVQKIDSKVAGQEEIVYAGVCSDNGCVGGSDLCMVVEILWGAFKRTCYTTVPDGPEGLAQN